MDSGHPVGERSVAFSAMPHYHYAGLLDRAGSMNCLPRNHHDDDRHDYAVAGCLTSYATKKAARSEEVAFDQKPRKATADGVFLFLECGFSEETCKLWSIAAN